VAKSGALSLPVLLSVMSLQIHTRGKIKGKRKITATFLTMADFATSSLYASYEEKNTTCIYSGNPVNSAKWIPSEYIPMVGLPILLQEYMWTDPGNI
jgi:hypothetical protein